MLRLPGYFLVNASLLAPVREINALKDALAASVEAARVALNLVPAARPRLMRQALGGQFSMMQLTRHIQCFDAAPRRLQFTWAGHTAGAEKLPVGQVRELLRARACSQAAELGVPLEQTPAAFELRSLVNLADEALLLRYKTLAPHPRAMLWFSAAGRYDAMVHANLPLLVRADPAQTPCVRPLPDFDREQRRAPRPDLKPRVAVIPRLNLYLPGEPRQRPARAGRAVSAVDLPGAGAGLTSTGWRPNAPGRLPAAGRCQPQWAMNRSTALSMRCIAINGWVKCWAKSVTPSLHSNCSTSVSHNSSRFQPVSALHGTIRATSGNCRRRLASRASMVCICAGLGSRAAARCTGAALSQAVTTRITRARWAGVGNRRAKACSSMARSRLSARST